MALTTGPGPFRPVFDNYTALDYKRATWFGQGVPSSWMAPMWVGWHRRRLLSYVILKSYADNASRYFRVPETDNAADFWATLQTNLSHREYGDADLLIKIIVAAVLGESQEVHVDRADEYDESLPTRSAVDQSESNPDEDNPNTPDVVAAWHVQELLRDWAARESLLLKLVETETDAVTMGDGVYTLGWDADKHRPRLRTWDPSFYFPVFDDFASDDDFPKKIHIAFENFDEEVRDDDESALSQPQTAQIRRITYELVDGEPWTPKWATEPTTKHCVMTDGIWTIDRMKTSNTDFEGQADSYATILDATGEHQVVDQLDIGLDFLPVIHLPNTPAGKDHFGQSSLLKVLQLLDDLQEADSDLAKARALTGSPMLAASNVGIDKNPLTVGPGQILRMGENGKITVIDAANGLKEMREAIQDLIERLSTNSRVPDAVMGRIEGKREPSGVALALKFGPLIAMIDHMRLVRNEKYQLMLKFVQRMYQADGQLPPGESTKPELVLGVFVPSDTNSIVANVTSLLQAHAIDQQTAAKMLIAGGIPIDDIAAMIRNIEERDFAGAEALLAATGDEQVVGDYLGVDLKPTPPPMPLNITPPNGQPTSQPPPNNQPPNGQAQGTDRTAPGEPKP